MAFGDRPLVVLLEEIDIGDSHRPYDAEAVSRLAKSIKDIGLQYPISVTANAGRFRLVAGRHRLEAFRFLAKTAFRPMSSRWTPATLACGRSRRTFIARN